MGDWWDQSRSSGFILEIDGELAGAVRVRRGRSAYWLRFGLHPQAQEHSDLLLHGALSLLWAAAHHPIYCSVRDYESGMSVALEQAGFRQTTCAFGARLNRLQLEQLLRGERQKFLAEEWPRICETIQRLGLNPEELLDGAARRAKSKAREKDKQEER